MQDINEINDIFLKILSDYLLEKQTVLNSAIDWKAVFDLAQKHQVVGVIYHQCKEYLKVDSRFCKFYSMDIYKAVNRQQSVMLFDEMLRDIPHVYIKGQYIAELYQVPQLRTMGDIDVLMSPKDIPLATEMILKNGGKRGEEKDSFYFHNQLYEIHGHLIHNYEEHKRYANYFEEVWNYVHNGYIEDNYHFLYIITHLKNHLVGSGVGVRQFMDVAIITRKKNLDWNWILSESKKIGLHYFLCRILEFNQVCFNVSNPLSVGNVEPCFSKSTINSILQNGVFGEGKDITTNNISILMSSNGGDYTSAKIKYIISRCFPSYEKMIEIYKYYYLKKYKILLPIAWMHRALKSLAVSQYRKSFFGTVFMKKSNVANNEKQFKEWGLW